MSLDTIWDFSQFVDQWRQDGKLTESPPEVVPNEDIKAIGEEIKSLSTFENYLKFPAPIPLPPDPVPTIENKKTAANRSSRMKPTLIGVSIVKPKAIYRSSSKVITPKQSTAHQKRAQFFEASPSSITITNFTLWNQHVVRFTLQNKSNKSSGYHLKSPVDSCFVLQALGDVKTSVIKPGLTVNFSLTFTPTQPRDYLDEIVFIPGPDEIPTIIQINCYRDPPKLILPSLVDIGAVLVHSQKHGEFVIKNQGGLASFSLSSPNGKEETTIYRDQYFSLLPSRFTLDHDEEVIISVSFFPTLPGFSICSLFSIF